ncbi:glycosyltransferase family 4 protein [Actinoplanes sp. NPDC051494]|uniref:glycosyltransferase family 4 protein n=1 Tax=Actinoplanes sp. NPDC051494 TaxID=3363907 RepID=UPI003793176D
MDRILMLSWEYPPLLVDGPGRHAHALATSLVADGHEVTVVTRHVPGAPREEFAEGVHVVRAPEDPPEHTDLVGWTTAFNHSLTRAALRAARNGRYDVVHAHDWLVAHSAMTLREHLDVPLVATMHSTEAGRSPGAPHHTIDDIERWLATEADRLIVCSDHMRREIRSAFGVSGAKVEVIRNGADLVRWYARPPAIAAARQRYAGTGPLLTVAGRLVAEKGVQHLLAALPHLEKAHPGLRVVIAGDGPDRAELEAAASPAVTFAGFLPEDELAALLGASDCHVVPSTYEPFGMIALEAAVAGAPVVAASTGGLAEIIEDGVTGVTFEPGNPYALADAVTSVLADRDVARTLARAGRRRVREDFTWTAVAAKTHKVYAAAARHTAWDAREAQLILAEATLTAPVTPRISA